MLPRGYTSRPAALADAEAVLALVSAHNEKVIGYADLTLDDVRADLVEPGFAPETDSWLVHAAGGGLVGYGWAYRKGAGEHVDIDVVADEPAVLEFLFDRALARAGEMAGGPNPVVGMNIYRADEGMRAAARARSFTPATTFQRMRIGHTGAVDPPAPPAGVTLHRGPGDAAFRRVGHRVLTESFDDHYGWVAKPFAEWHAMMDSHPAFDWSQLAVAELDGEPVGVLITSDRHVEDDCGHVSDLGVLPAARGRGIAGFLLRTAFADDSRAGRRGTVLHVDTNNTTPALGLYERAGMRPVLVIDAWERASPGASP